MRETNPFSYAAENISKLDSLSIVKNLEEEFGLTKLEAKTVWLSCPEFQESFCRKRTQACKEKGHTAQGVKMWLKRRFKLNEDEAIKLFEGFWFNKCDEANKLFLDVITVDRIAKSQLTYDAQNALLKLKKRYS